jgi:hypothetical protein
MPDFSRIAAYAARHSCSLEAAEDTLTRRDMVARSARDEDRGDSLRQSMRSREYDREAARAERRGY